MTRGSEVPTAELLAHQQWVSRLARHLAGDGAEDVAQDAWVAALRSPPPDEAGAEGRPWRPWLATVLHNLVRLRWRDQTRRARREQAFHALAPDHVEAVDQAYDRVELQRFLADAMMALDEPLRVVIVLRYVEGLDASRIAEVIGSPAGTVRWRLKTALDRLRIALDARCNGDRRAWVAVLVPAPFVGTPRTATTGATTATKGTLVMASMKLKASVAAVIAIALLMIGGTALWWARVGSSPLAARNASREPDRGVTLTRGTWAPAPRSGGLVGVVQRRDGTRVDGAIVVATVSTSGAAPGWNVDPAAEPTHARSGGDGAFRIEYIAPGRYVLTATKTGAGLARAQAIAVDRQTVRDIVLTLVEGRAGLSGRVVDSGGGGIAGARVLAGVLDGNTPIGFAAITDEQGRYALDLPSGDYHFEASADGYATARFGLYLHLPLLRDFRLHPASRITGRVRARFGGEALAGAEVSVVDLQNLDRERVTRTTLADEAGRFVFASMDPGTYRLIAHRNAFVGQHPRRVVVGLADEVAVDVTIEQGRTARGTVQSPDGKPVAGAAVMVPFGPLEFLAARQPGVHGSTDAEGRFALEGLPAVPQMEILALAPQGKAQQPIDLAARDLDGIRLQLAAQGTVSGVVLDQRRQPIADARVAAATGTPHGRWSAAVRTDEQGRFRIEGLATGALTLSALGSAGAIEMKAGRLEQGGVRDVELVLAQGGSVAGVARLPNGKPAAAVPVFAFASQSNGAPWSHPTASCSTNADGSYHLAPLPEGEVVVRVVNPGDDPFAGLPGRSHRRDRAFVVLSAGESKTGVDLVVSRNDLTISGRVVDADGRPVAGAALNAIPNGDGAAVPRARTLSQVDGQFLIEGLSEGPHTIVVTQGDQSDMRREGVPAGSAGIELRLEKYGSLDGVVVDSSGRPVPTFVVVARPLLGPNPSEPDLRSHWGRPQLRAEILSQPDGAFRLPAVPAATYEIVAFGPDHSVATLHPLVVAAGEPRHNLRLTTRPGATIRGRVVDHRTGLPIAGARAEGRGTAHGLITGATNADGWFSLSGLPAGNVADFAVTGPGAAYITDCQHRAIPADGTTVEIGEVRLFPGPVLKLTMAGQVATGLWFHSREGRPMVHAVAADSIAAAAGARPGELVLAVDGSDVRKLSSSVVEGLVATGGPTVNLTVQAPGSRSTRTLSVAHVDPAAR